MNSRLDLFNKQLLRNGIDGLVAEVPCKMIVKDIQNQDLKETKYMYIPLDIDVSVGDTISIEDKKYMILNSNTTNCYHEVVVQEIYHTIKIKYSWLPLMMFNVIPVVGNQTLIDDTFLIQEKTSLYVQLQRNEISKQIKKGTRFFLFNVPYKISSITYENSNIFTFKCEIDGISPQDDEVNQIADNSDIKPPFIEYTITSSCGENGTIIPLGEVTLKEHESQEFTISANDNYEIDTVLVDGKEIAITDSKYTFNDVTSNHTINATFKEKPVALEIVETHGRTDLYKGYANEYVLSDGSGNVSPVTWSVDKTWIILTQDGTKCTIKYNDLDYEFEIVTLTATYNGKTYTIKIECVTL